MAEDGETPAPAGKGVTIRMSERGDLEARIELGRRSHAESAFADLPYDEGKVRRGIERGLAAPDSHCLLQADFAGETVGVLYGVANEHYFSPALAATILSFYVVPEHRGSTAAVKLLHGFRRWAHRRRVARLYINVTSGISIARTDRFLRRLGFRPVGGNYMLEP